MDRSCANTEINATAGGWIFTSVSGNQWVQKLKRTLVTRPEDAQQSAPYPYTAAQAF